MRIVFDSKADAAMGDLVEIGDGEVA